MDSEFPTQAPQQPRKRTPDKSNLIGSSTREQNPNCFVANAALNDGDEGADTMTKKQRHGSPDHDPPDGGDSTGTSSETGDAVSCCAHAGKAVNCSLLRKVLYSGSNGATPFTDCVDCKRNGDTPPPPPPEPCTLDDSVWICLRCGHAGCGRGRAAHAVAHNAAPHSDPHDLVVQANTWRVWCYKCDDDVHVTKRTAKLRDAIQYLKKLSVVTVKSPGAVVPPPSTAITYDVSACALGARGLRNLGNTCFFNSVMQCLGVTPYLVTLLRETEQSGRAFVLAGGVLPRADTVATAVEPLRGELRGWGPLAEVLTVTLEALRCGRAEVYNPRPLLNQLATKHPQFRRGDQQDAHELLRHLLEAVREEDLRRYQEVILCQHKLSRKTDPTSIDANKRKILKFYGSQAEVLLPTLRVFKGLLVSTLQCKDCGRTSNREEFFLDLSLPISEQQPKHRRRADGSPEDSRPSKHQVKKEKRAAAKRNRTQKNNHSSNLQMTQVTSDTGDSDAADVEDNLDEGACSVPETQLSDARSANSGQQTADGAPLAGVCDGERRAGCDGGCVDTDHPIARGNDLKDNLAKLTLDYYPEARDEEKMELDSPQEDTVHGASPVDEGDGADARCTYAPLCDRYSATDGECSVQSCLAQFTSSELMMGANAVLCPGCTGRTGGPKQYRSALKQLLICQPPPVLILHLKRFQVHHYHSTKLAKQVSFPLTLDLAPFCSRRVNPRDSTLPDSGNTVLYGLYGVVEHSGSIHGGHYVAYVNVRPPVDRNSVRWKHLSDGDATSEVSNGVGEEEVSAVPGRWYYVSDSHVQQVSEERVLSSQAYVLFYERIV